jgi:hypothetical protein
VEMKTYPSPAGQKPLPVRVLVHSSPKPLKGNPP